MEEKELTPNNAYTPKEEKKKKVKKPPKKRETKTVVLDNFGKRIMLAFICLAFVAIIVPFAVVTISRKTGIEDVSVNSAVKYVEDAFDKKVNSITYSHKVDEKTESETFTFSGGVLYSRESIASGEKTVMRKPTIDDSSYIRQKYPDKSDNDIVEYLGNNADYLIITYKENSSGEYIEESFSLATSNYETFISKGTNYKAIISYISKVDNFDNNTITKANAKTNYDIFGLGYTYENYKVYFGNSYMTFDGSKVTAVYDFSTTTTYEVVVNM